MNQNETRTLWISVFAAIFAVFLIYSYTQEKKKQLDTEFGAKNDVVLAKVDINEMQTIDDSMLEVVERPVSFIGPSALSNPENAVGLVALAPIKKGEQILESKIMEPGPVTGLSIQVTPGRRAVSIPVDESRAVSKLIKPGDRIDILAALDVGSGPARRREVRTIMQDVTVLATGLRVVNELPRLYEREGRSEFIKNLRADTAFSTLTIETSPQDAQELIYILSTAPSSLFITLRHPSDTAPKVNIPNATLQSVLGSPNVEQIGEQLARKPAAALPPPPPPKPAPSPRQRGPFKDI